MTVLKQERPVVELMETQADFVTSETPRYLGFTGGFRAGKTIALCHKAIFMANANLNLGVDGALLSPTKDQTTRVIVPAMNQILQKVGFRPIPNNSPFTPGTYMFWGSDAPRYVINFPNGAFTIWLLAAESAEERAVGISLAWFGIDEFDKIESIDKAKACWNIMISRLTRGNVVQGFITSTPEGFRFLNWFFNEDVYREDGTRKTDRRLIVASSEDNPYIDPEYCNHLREMFPAKLAEAYIHGKFVNLTTGNVYHAYDRELNNTNETILSFPTQIPICIGVDFNVGIMASTVSVVVNNVIYVIDEIYGEQNTESLIKRIKRDYPGRVIHMFPDSNAKSTGVSPYIMFENAGFKVFRLSQNPRVADRYNAVNAKMCNANGHRTLFVNSKRCPKLVKSLEQQGFVNGEPDKNGNLDHIVDALGYQVYRQFPLQQINAGRIIVSQG